MRDCHRVVAVVAERLGAGVRSRRAFSSRFAAVAQPTSPLVRRGRWSTGCRLGTEGADPRDAHRPAPGEGVEHNATGGTDPHEPLHHRRRLPGHVVLVRHPHRLADHAPRGPRPPRRPGSAPPHTTYSHCAANRPIAGRHASVLSQTTIPRQTHPPAWSGAPGLATRRHSPSQSATTTAAPVRERALVPVVARERRPLDLRPVHRVLHRRRQRPVAAREPVRRVRRVPSTPQILHKYAML